MATRKKRRFHGNCPAPDSGYEQVGVISDGEARFRVFVRPRTDAGWFSIKVVAAEPVKGKANFWLGWNGTRWAHNIDERCLRERYPEFLTDIQTLIGDGDAP